MKKIILTSLVLIVSALSIRAQKTGDSYASSRQSKKANLTYVYHEVPTLVERDGNGKQKGLLVEVMKQFEAFVKDSKGITITSSYVEESEFRPFLKQIESSKGGVFGLSNVSITEERQKIYSFSPAYLNSISVLITNTNTPTLTAMEDLGTAFSGKVAFTLGGSTNAKRLEDIKKVYYPEMVIKTKSSTIEVIEEVTRNDAAFTTVDLIHYMALSTENPLKRHAVGDFRGDKLGMVMPKDNDWAPVLEEFLTTFLKSPEYRTLVIDNLGKASLRMIE